MLQPSRVRILAGRRDPAGVCIPIIVVLLFLGTSATISAGVLLVPGDLPSIQSAIEAAQSGDSVLVASGEYHESLNFMGKNITVSAVDGPLWTTITNDRKVNLVTFKNGETRDAVFEGFTLMGGWIAVLCVNSAPTIRYNVCMDQNVTNWAAICLSGDLDSNLISDDDPKYSAHLGEAPAVIVNNTIVHSTNGGISSFSISAPVIWNNIIALNSHYGVHFQGGDEDGNFGNVPQVGYNDVFGNPTNYYNFPNPGPGSISRSPMFVDPSQNNWILQEASPCVDAGDPGFTFNDPDGSRNDMGALALYEASRFCCEGRVGDIYSDGIEGPTVTDLSRAIDAVLISGVCRGNIDCVAEADVNQSGGRNPSCIDITVGDIAILVDYLFVTGSSLVLMECL